MITLLNGEQREEHELLEKMLDDNFYYGFLGQHALSSSSLKTILKSPKTYRHILKYGSADTPALAQGRLLHWAILEPHKLDQMHFVEASTKTTKIYKEAKAKYENVYLQKERKEIERLQDAIFRNEAALQLLNGADYEVPAISMIDGLPFRGKADILKKDIICDLKTSSDLISFRYSADKYGYDLQAWLYLQLFPDKKEFVFLVVDKGSTDIGVFECSDEFLQRGEDKFHQAVSNYKYFFQEDNDLDQYVMRGIL